LFTRLVPPVSGTVAQITGEIEEKKEEKKKEGE
jgi:hypothetical protein